jgi:hypothetical protein
MKSLYSQNANLTTLDHVYACNLFKTVVHHITQEYVYVSENLDLMRL